MVLDFEPFAYSYNAIIHLNSKALNCYYTTMIMWGSWWDGGRGGGERNLYTYKMYHGKQ